MVARMIAAAALSLGLALGAAGCSSEGAKTSCSLSSCEVTFDRNAADPKATVLGVEVVLVSATDESATISVAGQQITIPNNESASVGDFSVTLKEVTDSEIKIEIQPA